MPNAAHQLVRELGWTRLFVDAAKSWGRDRGAGVVRLNTCADGPVAVPFHERHGYRRRSIVFAKELA